MAASSLTDRYIDAVTRTVPDAQRADVAAELRASIADQLDARLEAGEDAGAAERAVLDGLGDPDRLAAGYADRPLHLIGPRFYLEWQRLVKLLLWIVVPLAAFGIALGQTISGAGIGEIIGSTIGGAISVGIHVVFWTTLVFFLVERSGAAAPATRWSVDQLPEPADTGAKFSDAVASVVLLVVAGAALVWDQLVGTVYLHGHWMPFFSPQLWPWWIGGLLLIMAVDAALHIVVSLNRRWTMPLAIANAVLNLLVVLAALWLLSQRQLLNPEFWHLVLPEADSENVFDILSVITGFAIAGIGGWDMIDAFLKARRARRRPRAA